jgi:hypothetical protein
MRLWGYGVKQDGISERLFKAQSNLPTRTIAMLMNRPLISTRVSLQIVTEAFGLRYGHYHKENHNATTKLS